MTCEVRGPETYGGGDQSIIAASGKPQHDRSAISNLCFQEAPRIARYFLQRTISHQERFLPRFAPATYITKGNVFLTVENGMDRTNEIANQLVVKVREYFPKPVRHCFVCRCEAGTKRASTTIAIYGRFPNQLPQYDPKLLGLIGGVVTKIEKELLRDSRQVARPGMPTAAAM